MTPRRATLALLLAAALGAETIDRIAVTVDNQPLTLSLIDEEIRVTAFLNGEAPATSPAARHAAADRLVERVLLHREMEYTHYPDTASNNLEPVLEQLRARHGGADGLARALAAARLTEARIKEAIAAQSTLLRFIDLRFRPEVQVQDVEVRQYYDTVLAADYRRRQAEPPPFDEVRDDCEEALIAGRVDKRVEAWLNEVKARTRIRYREAAFQ